MYIFQPERFLLKKQIKKFVPYIKGRILDIGSGEFSRYESFFNYKEYIKMDIQKNENVDVVGRAEDIPFEDSSFDSIVCTQVFEHLDQPFKAASEISRVLKKNGFLLLTVPQVNELHSEPIDYFRYTKYGIESIFNNVGLEVVDYAQVSGFFSLKAQLNVRYLIDFLNLYNHKITGKIFSKFFKIYSFLMFSLDRLDKSKANRKHVIDWCFILKKK